MRLECADVLFHGVRPANVSNTPWEVTEGAALQRLKADLKEEGRKAPGKSIFGMVEHKNGSSCSLCHTERPVTCLLCIRSPDGEWTDLSAVVQKSTPDRDFRVHKLHLPSPDPELPFTSSAFCHDHQGVRLRTYVTRQWCIGLPVGEHDRGFSHVNPELKA